jgi:hypothetical protein
MNEPGPPPEADQCVFVRRGDQDNRVFAVGERVCVTNYEGERTMGKIVEDTPHDFVRLTLDTDFPSRLARGQDRAGLRLMQSKVYVGKMLGAEVENPGDLEGGRRRSSSKRVRKVTRRRRHRKSSRKLRSKLL